MAKNTLSGPLMQFEAVLTESCMAAMDIASSETRDYAKKNHNYKDRTGGVTAATREIKSQNNGGVITGGVENTSQVGMYLHEGTGLYGPKGAPYVIKPKTAKALYFEAAGAISLSGSGAGVFTKKVIHPGIRPDPWIARAVHAMQPRFVMLMNLAVQRACRWANKQGAK